MINIWPDNATVKEDLPMTMKRKFPNVVIFGCTEIYAEVPQSLVMHKLLYSDYKSHVRL